MTYNFFPLTFWNTSLFLYIISGSGNKVLNVKSNTGMPAFYSKNPHILEHSFLAQIFQMFSLFFFSFKFKLVKQFPIRFLRTSLFHLLGMWTLLAPQYQSLQFYSNYFFHLPAVVDKSICCLIAYQAFLQFGFIPQDPISAFVLSMGAPSNFLIISWISNTMLNKSAESGHLCFVPDLRRRSFSFSLLCMMLTVGLSYIAFILFGFIPSIPTLVRYY